MSGPIVVYGGSFDPVHLAHEAMVQAAIEQLQPEKVLIVPCHIPPHKEALKASNEDRLAMLELVFKQQPKVVIDTRELETEAPSFTVHTVRALRNEFGPDTSINFLLGGDSWRNFTSWFEWREILNLVNILIASRPGEALESDELKRYQNENSARTSALHDSAFGAIARLDFAEQDVASKEIRQALAKRGTIVEEDGAGESSVEESVAEENGGANAAQCLNAEVYAYIAKHGLYGAGNKP